MIDEAQELATPPRLGRLVRISDLKCGRPSTVTAFAIRLRVRYGLVCLMRGAICARGARCTVSWRPFPRCGSAATSVVTLSIVLPS